MISCRRWNTKENTYGLYNIVKVDTPHKIFSGINCWIKTKFKDIEFKAIKNPKHICETLLILYR